MLAYSDMHPEDMTNIYQIKLSDILGYRPRLERCVYCDRAISTVDRFSIYNGGIVCDGCYDRRKLVIIYTWYTSDHEIYIKYRP